MAYQIAIIMINSCMAMKHIWAPINYYGGVCEKVFRSQSTWGIIYISNRRNDISGTILEFRYSNTRRVGSCLKIIEPPPKDWKRNLSKTLSHHIVLVHGRETKNKLHTWFRGQSARNHLETKLGHWIGQRRASVSSSWIEAKKHRQVFRLKYSVAPLGVSWGGYTPWLV